MKSYTDLEQSKKLAEILPLESADMFCADVFNKEEGTHSYNFHILSTWGCNTFEELKDRENKFVHFIPCWSLAALLEQLDDEITDDNGNDYNLTIVKESLQYQLYYHDSWGQVEDIETNYYDDLVDACVEMIEKLHKQKLL